MDSFFGTLLMIMAVALNIMAFMASPSLSLSFHHKLKIETIAASPALLPADPLNPYTEISPDIAPLLPSSGGTVPPSSGSSSISTIPSNPSNNPEEIPAFGPDSAVSPSGQLEGSSAGSLNLVVRSVNFGVFMVFLSCWSVLVFLV